MEEEIQDELANYQTISREIDEIAADFSEHLKQYQDLLSYYSYSIKVIHGKTELWRSQRVKRLKKISEKLNLKWSDVKTYSRADPALEQEERIFQAVVRTCYNKPSEYAAFMRKREEAIRTLIHSAGFAK